MKVILLVATGVINAKDDGDVLKNFGYGVIVAESGEKAVELAGSDQQIDLILMDIDLGSPFDGAQAAQEILLHRDVPILFFTSHLDEEMVSLAMTIPHYGYIAKSSGKFVLQTSIDRALKLFDERESGGRLNQVLSALREVIWLRDIKTRKVLYVNPAFEQLCKLKCEDFYNDPEIFINLIHPEDKPRIQRGISPRSDIHRILRPDGSVRWVWGRSIPVKNEAGEVYRTANIVEDITERKQTEEDLKQANEKLLKQMEEIQLLQADLRDQAIRDPLTGLYNRRFLNENLDRELDRAKREGYSVSLVMIDIDEFKQVNDTYGHYAGDLVLKQLAVLLVNQTRSSDLICRLSGDEFLLVLPNLSAQIAFERADQCRRAFRESIILFDEVEIRATLSIGIAAFPDDGSTIKDVFQAADAALYEAKIKGRDRVMTTRRNDNVKPETI
jgi:diguanylate cyclase (GGDEF)-like protein/PAS domain S-box-containing protein